MSTIQATAEFGSRRSVGIALRGTIVALTLVTAFFHSTLGGLLFTANAAGYAVLAVAMVLPIGIAVRHRWLVRAALLGFTAATIVGWVLIGARYDMAYMIKGVEVALVAALVIEMIRYDGGPVAVVRRSIAFALTIVRLPFARRSGA